MDDNTHESAPASHYERLGGQDTIREAVDRFYAAVLGDPELAGYFTDVDIDRVKRHQVLLLSDVLGGPESYDGPDLGQAHRGLGITDGHYDKVVGYLVAVFTDLGADGDTIAAAAEVLASVKPQIVEDQAGSRDSHE
ncbi:MAG TPA: group 1 truncated hemoglobin [Acidimicrobiales bacterium]|jgi:hemoglobin|nr:group 1 truncated hemoglobin [Acidimicrobiales bacterium]